MLLWPLGETVKLFCVKTIAMGEFEISVGASCQQGVGGGFIMSHGASLANW
jgi:hypothetical protein